MAAKGQAQAAVVRDNVLALGGSAQHRHGLGERGHLSERERCLDAEHLPASLMAVAAKPPAAASASRSRRFKRARRARS